MTDLSKDIDAALETSAKKVSDSLTGTILSIAKDQIQKIRLDWKVGFKKLSENQYAKCSRVKTLLYRYEPAELAKIYVPTTFSIPKNDQNIVDRTLIANATEGKRYIISGLAGSGKSMFMRFLCLHLLTEAKAPFPIFLELRDLNAESEPSILNFITDKINTVIGDFTLSQLQYGLRSGVFFLILDGFDELNLNLREVVEKEIIEISENYLGCGLIVSARPNTLFDSWPNFFAAKVEPLSEDGARDLIRRLDFDAAVKQKFLDRISDLYVSHRGFLSNPLLATMMLLTFDQYADIPNKIHIFYAKHSRPFLTNMMP
jgi:predicted NACHT family NTPase